MRKLFEEVKKSYLLLLSFSNEDKDERQSWAFVEGRDQALEEIVDYCQVYASDEYTIDFDESKILVEGVNILEAQSLRKFLNYCIAYKYMKDAILNRLLNYNYTPEKIVDISDMPRVVKVSTVNNEKVNNFIDDDIIKEEI